MGNKMDKLRQIGNNTQDPEIEKEKVRRKQKMEDKGHPILGEITAVATGYIIANPISVLVALAITAVLAILYMSSAFAVLFNPFAWAISVIVGGLIARDGYITIEELYIYPVLLGAVFFFWESFQLHANYVDAWGGVGGGVAALFTLFGAPKLIVYSMAFGVTVTISAVVLTIAVRYRDDEKLNIGEILNLKQGEGGLH